MAVSFPTEHGESELPADWNDPQVAELLEGTVDLHVHPFPSPFPRRMGIVEAATDAAKAKYRAILVKSHHHSMITDVLALQSSGVLDALDVKIYAGVALNPFVGGLNPHAVDLGLNLGAKMVWFPTLSSKAHVAHESGGGTFPNATIQLRQLPALTILEDDGSVKPVVSDILEQIRDHQAILNCGHLPADEIDALIPTAVGLGVERIVVTHPNFIVGATPERAAGWAGRGAFIEHEATMYTSLRTDRGARWDLSVLRSYVDVVGFDHTILGSDCGQQGNTRPVDSFRLMVRQMLDGDFTEKQIKSLISTNAGSLIPA